MMNAQKQAAIQNMPEAYKKQLVKYLFQCIASEGSKILVFAIIALVLDIFNEFLFAMVLLILLRTNGGGLHFKHYIGCLLMSFAVLFGSIALGIWVPFSTLVSCIILLASILLGYRCVPVVSANRPPATEQVVRKSKRNTSTILVIYFILICIVPMNRYLNIGVWIIIIHICQLLLAKLLRRRKK